MQSCSYLQFGDFLGQNHRLPGLNLQSDHKRVPIYIIFSDIHRN